jgi:hypothetical protein
MEVKMKKVVVLLSILILLFAVTSVYAGSDSLHVDPSGDSNGWIELQVLPVKDTQIRCPTRVISSDDPVIPNCPVPWELDQ